MTATSTAPEPALRGMIHAGAVPLVLATGVVIVALAPSSGARLALALYAVSATALFSISASYHLSEVGGLARRVLRRLDHAGIFVIIAGTYTPFLALALSGGTRIATLSVVWGAAAAGVAIRLLWDGAPRWLVVGLYLALGWTALLVFPQLLAGAGLPAIVLAIVGGGIYTLGAIVYALRQPDPLPRVLGFHEVFHILTVAAFACLDVGVWLLVHGPA